jgi:prepilin signal peptidase PulO-like enzyme (type II secretory pathway)
MEVLTSAFIFILGLIIGSFINALSYRYNSGKGMMTRSVCFSCGHTLNFLDLVPVFSFLFLASRCRYCRSRISLQYPIVELGAGLVFLLIYLKFPTVELVSGLVFGELILTWLFWSIFLFIAVYDLKHKIVPDAFVYTMVLIGLAVCLLFASGEWWWNMLQGFFVFLPFFLLWLLSRGRYIGLGDGKIILALGLFLPIEISSSGVILSFWIGSVYALGALLLNRCLNLRGKKLTMKSELPFVPFLLLGSFISYVLSLDILSLSIW